MRDVFFESDHAAKINYPYTDFEWRNINFFSHFHEEIELAAIVSGSVSITDDERALSARSGDICVFMPGEIHSLTSDSENHLYIFKIYCRSAKENIDFAAFRIKPDILTPEHPLNAALWADKPTRPPLQLFLTFINNSLYTNIFFSCLSIVFYYFFYFLIFRLFFSFLPKNLSLKQLFIYIYS